MNVLAPKFGRLIALVCVLVLNGPGTLLAQDATSLDPSATGPLAGAAAHGVQLANMDLSVDPAQDFYRYATGGWQDQSEIPPDEALYGAWEEVIDLTRQQLLTLLRNLGESGEIAVGSDEWKVVQLFAQANDLATREAQGIDPIAGDLAQIDAISSLDDLYAFLRVAPLTTNISCALYCLVVYPDYVDSSVYAAWHSSPYLGLPTRDYYWVDDESNEAIREAYREMSAALLGSAGYDPERAVDAARRVYEFEKLLAEPMFRMEEWNDPQNYYHPRPVADLIAANPDFDWPAFLANLGISGLDTVIVQEEDYLAGIDGIVTSADLETIKDYLTLQLLRNTALSLTEELGDTHFAFYGTVLEGREQRRPLEEQALELINTSLGEALGELYVDEYFPPEAKVDMEALVDNLIAASRARIERLEWMNPETQVAAIAKLETMRVKVGYPDAWRSYAEVNIEESLAQTLLSASVAETTRWLDRIGQSVDRDEWFTLPQVVNAFYNPSNNEIVFPAAILQPPYFDYQADAASNYGSIGAIIGHEITHGFDQGGSQFDGDGNLVDWWTAEDLATFESLTAEVAAQYDAIEVLPGLNVDGELTIGENIADLGGLQIAHDALQLALAESGDPGPIDGLSQVQRFFIAYGFAWSEEVREEYLRTQLETDFHAPEAVRGVQPARNMDVFHEVFGIEPGDPMYLPADERIVIW